MTNTQHTTCTELVLTALICLGGERLWGEIWGQLDLTISNPARIMRRLVISGQVIEGERNGMRTFEVAA